MLENIVIELSKRLSHVKTLSTRKENKITKFDDKGLCVETESSRSKYQKSERQDPFEFISFDFILEGWHEFISVRNVEANDFKKTRGRTSFLMALFSNLPFVEASTSGKTASIHLREFKTDELPNVQYQNLKGFFEEMGTGTYDPAELSKHFGGNLYRIKSRNRQDARLIGFVNEFNEVNQFMLDEYIEAENKDQYIQRILLNLGYFRIALICLDLLRNLPKKEKKVALEELGMLIVRNSQGDNLMVESVAKDRTNYLFSWLENTQLIDPNWIPTENFFDTLSTKEQAIVSEIRSSLVKVMNEYLDAKREGFGGHPLGGFVRNDIPKEVQRLDFIDSAKYMVTGSVGQGNWASVPWIAIMNRKITVSTQRGYYKVYLFSEDLKTVYLTLAQGVTETSKEEMQRIKEEIRKSIPASSKVKKDDDIHLGISTKAKQYAQSTAAYIQYHIDNIPNESTLVADLQEMVRIYEDYIALKNGYKTTESINSEQYIIRETGTTNLHDKELIDHIHSYIKSKGFLYKREEVINLFLSLKTKPFVILSGISGTGKTKMVQWFAESVGATEENGQFALIPIRPDWNDGSDLLGYVDIKGDFKEGPLTKVIKRAEANPDLPYFVLLDEMNLARVEYYFSDILSVMESRKWKDSKIVSTNLLSMETAGFDLKLPNNLYIVGTVNMDETTHPFSKKVLDRANTIEFNRVELGNLAFLHDLDEKGPAVIGHKSFASIYLHLKDVYQKHTVIVDRVTDELVKMNEALQLINAHVGYRVRDEICFYIAYNIESELMSFEKSLDHCILQKVLPRIAGSDTRVDQLLRDLYLLFTTKQFEEDLDIGVLDLENAIYPQSVAKVVEMLRRLREDGFTSFWIS
ncbi:MrcB family domain-containing protein [Bacillus sp. OTU2372]|uniref:MrcB family domain-containing protein n=1 Tax=Bacillus sp. OTU2372 TaxID=3043858 RepID=UPI00313E5336